MRILYTRGFTSMMDLVKQGDRGEEEEEGEQRNRGQSAVVVV